MPEPRGLDCTDDVSQPSLVHESNLERPLRSMGLDSTAGSSEEQPYDDSSQENLLNRNRLAEFKRRFEGKFLKALENSEFEFGNDALADRFLRERLKENEMATKTWLNEIFIDRFNQKAVVTGLLRVIAHLEHSEIAPQGPTMALAAMTHSDVEVRECGVRALENWGSQVYITALQAVDFPEPWLQDYVSQVVTQLQEAR